MQTSKRSTSSSRDLQEAYKAVKAGEQQKRAHGNEIRQLAWFVARASKPYAWRWWRLGFQTVYGARVERSDFTVVPGYDVIHREVAHYFPEYDSADGCERLWALLMSPYEAMPRKSVMMAEAKLMLRKGRKAKAVAFEFGANAAEGF